LTDLHEMGLTDPCLWANRGRAQLMQRPTMDRSCISRCNRNGSSTHGAARNPRWEILATHT